MQTVGINTRLQMYQVIWLEH